MIERALQLVSLWLQPALVIFLIAINQDILAFFAISVGAGLNLLREAKAIRQRRKDHNYAGFLDATGVDPDTGHPNLRLVITQMPEEVLSANEVRLKIGHPPTSNVV